VSAGLVLLEIARLQNAGGELAQDPETSRRSALAAVAQIAALAAVYAVFARIGLLLDPVGGFATVVWAPTGIAIAAALLLGYRAAAGIWIGAFIANLAAGAPTTAAAVIALGNTLEAVVAVLVLSRVRSFDRSLPRTNDVLLLLVVGAILAPAVSATIGMAALLGTNVVAPAELTEGWRAWWVGDSIGALLITPTILFWRAQGWRSLTPRWREAAALLAALVIVASLVFATRSSAERTAFLQAYLIFPVLLWAAMRFEQRGATTAVLLTSVFAVVGTAQGQGPFVVGELRDSLFALQTFMGIVAMSVLLLSAAIAERAHAAHTATRLLAATGVADRAKSDFLAAMSHELRTPLNAIGGYAQMLMLEIHGALTAQQREAVQRIETNQRHLAGLVADVLSFTRTESGRLTMQLEDVDVASMLESLPAYVGPDADRKGIQLCVAPVYPGLIMRADPERVRQILLNLLVNAIKFSDANGAVAVSADRAGMAVRIAVADQGIGIPADQLHRVFEPFFQVERGHASRYPGVGLGLTIARQLALAMHGDVVLESEQGKGTTVTLVVPLVDPARVS
jgi:signal transduction histidine kinase